VRHLSVTYSAFYVLKCLCYTFVLFVNSKFIFLKMQFSLHHVMPHWPYAQLWYLRFFALRYLPTLRCFFTLYHFMLFTRYTFYVLCFTLFTHSHNISWCFQNLSLVFCRKCLLYLLILLFLASCSIYLQFLVQRKIFLHLIYLSTTFRRRPPVILSCCFSRYKFTLLSCLLVKILYTSIISLKPGVMQLSTK